ncbi:MAG: tungsten formylmethanofuran dehydrogenase, partial [Bacteroidetes bacterium]
MEQQQQVLKAYKLMCTARAMADIYEANRNICTYVHSTSKGHEAIQLATAFQLQHFDYVSPYYRDESLLLGLGFTPFQLMCQLLAKGTDEFSGGRTYYSHPSFKTDGVKPTIIHQSSATGMQAIPTTGVAQAVEYIANNNDVKNPWPHAANPVVVCSLGDNSVTEGEVAEAWQFAVLKQLPIIYLVQDNDWGISVTAAEARAMNAAEYAAGFKGMAVMEVDGSDFLASTQVMQQAFSYVRTQRKPLVVRATVPLLGHHTSGVRKEFYRTEDDLRTHAHRDPFVFLHSYLLQNGYSETLLQGFITEAKAAVANDFELAQQQPNPLPNTVEHHVFAPTAVTQETGTRVPANGEKTLMVDAALLAIEQIMQQHPEALLYGQDVGKRLGGVFREAATLGDKFGDARVFNTAIQEAYIVGSTVGMSALGLRPIVEVQFADYIYPGFNQLVTEISKSCYLSNGKFPVSMVLRVPTGAYGGGGP